MLNIIQRCIWPMSLFCGWKNDCEAPLLGVAYRAQIEILTVANDKFLSANLRVNSKNSSFVKGRYWGYGELFLPALIVSRFRPIYRSFIIFQILYWPFWILVENITAFLHSPKVLRLVFVGCITVVSSPTICPLKIPWHPIKMPLNPLASH
jgi:hypothetical protein